MRLILAAMVLTVAAHSQSPVQVKAGALICGAVRRPSPATVPTAANIQTYCYLGAAIVTNYSNLILPGASAIVTHQWGPGCLPGGQGACDIVTWQFWPDVSGAIAYQAEINATGEQKGTLP